MAQIIDQIVKISIQDAISSVTTVDVNTVALVGKAEGKDAAEVSSLAGAKTAFGDDSELYQMMKAFFAQDSHPSRVVGIPAGSDALAAVQAASENFDFYHVVVATDDAQALALASIKAWNEWAADVKKMIHIQVPNVGAMAGTDSRSDAGYDRVAVYVHKEMNSVTQTVYDSDTRETTVTKIDKLPDGWTDHSAKKVTTAGTETTTVEVSWEFLNVGVVALRCASDSARGTFAHKKCKGVTPDSYSVEEYNGAIDLGLNIYVKVSGEARLFMGTTSSNEKFIDQIIKDDWIRFNVQSRIYRLLGEGNDGNGVNYDDAGIGAVAASVLNVLTVAQDTDHQYVMADSASVDYKPYSYLVENYADDVRKRNLPLIKGRYARMNSIHTVVQVDLQVTL